MSRTITGTDDLEVFFSALGKGLASPELEALMAMVGGQFATAPAQKLTRKTTQYLTAPAQGVEILLTDGSVSTIFLTVQPKGEKQPYPGIDRLFDGLGATSPREDFRVVLGPAIRSKPVYDFFGSDGRFVHAEFDSEDRLSRLNLTAIDVFARPGG